MLQVAQTPLPPLPPPLQPDPNFLAGRVQEVVMMLIGAVACVIIAVKVLGPIARAWARRLESKAGDPQLRAEVDELRDQLGEMDGLKHRVLELEERLEFTERMLTQRRDQELLRGEQKS